MKLAKKRYILKTPPPNLVYVPISANTENAVIDCGGHDFSSNNFPALGGTGTSGAIQRGNQFDVTVGGTPPGDDFVPVGSVIRAKVNNPGQTLSNWKITRA